MSATLYYFTDIRHKLCNEYVYFNKDVYFGFKGFSGDSVKDIDELVPINKIFKVAHPSDNLLALGGYLIYAMLESFEVNSFLAFSFPINALYRDGEKSFVQDVDAMKISSRELIL